MLLHICRRFRHYEGMDADQVAALRVLLAPTGWLDRTRYFAQALRRQARTRSGLLIVGTPQFEPWHMAAHLQDESQLAGIPELAPVLVRWAPPPGAPAHLSIGIERLEAASRDDALLVVSEQAAPASLLERLADARKSGTTIFALDQDDAELDELAHEALPVPGTAPVSFDAAQHLVSAATAESPTVAASRMARLRGGRPGDPAATLRGRLARLLDTVSGPQVD